MGDRGQVLIKDSGVYLYTHWGGTELLKIVKKAISRKVRWDNEEYLTRIIFDAMTDGEQGEETGHGIGTKKHSDIEHPLIIIDCKNKQITFEPDSFGSEIKVQPMSFEKLINSKLIEGDF